MAVSPGGPRSPWHARLSWEAGVSFVSLESCVEIDLTGLSLGAGLAHQARHTLRPRQSFKTVPAREPAVALGPWLAREPYLSWGPLRPGGSTQPFHVTDEAAVSLLTFLSDFATQSRLPWCAGRTLIARRPGLTLHDAVGVAWLPGGPRGAGKAWEPVLSAWSWQRHAWQSLVAFFSSLAGEAGSTGLAGHRKAWKSRLALDPWVTFGAWLSSEPRCSREASLAFLSQGSRADHNARWAWGASFSFLSLGARAAGESGVPRVSREAQAPLLPLLAVFAGFSPGPWFSGFAFLANPWNSLKSRFTFLTLLSLGGKVPFLLHLSLSWDSRRPTDALISLVTFRSLET